MSMPTTVNLPSNYRDAYRPSAVIAAIPLGHGSTYVVTSYDPDSSPAQQTYITAEVSRGHFRGAPWFADEYWQFPLLADALRDMAQKAGLAIEIPDEPGWKPAYWPELLAGLGLISQEAADRNLARMEDRNQRPDIARRVTRSMPEIFGEQPD